MGSDSTSPRALRQRIISFVTVVLSILLAGNGFVCLTWHYFWKMPAMAFWTALSFVLTLAFVAASILGRLYASPWLNWIYRISAVWLGLLNYFLFAAMAAWILLALTPLERRQIAAICFGGAVLVTVYGLANASWLRVTRVTVKLPNLPGAWRECHVALVTDLHLGNVRGAGLSRRVVDRLERLRPEAVFISGDLFDGPEADFDALLEPWKRISGAMGIYFVTGNHEEFTGRGKYLDAARRAGFRILDNEMTDVRSLQIAGAHDEEIHDPEIYRALLRRAQLDRHRASILLAHQALHLAIPNDEGISLLLCGHTHGGQFWPWTLVARRVHGQFTHGLNRIGNMQVLTSYGVGTWGAPMRIGTKSEIILIRLELAV